MVETKCPQCNSSQGIRMLKGFMETGDGNVEVDTTFYCSDCNILVKIYSPILELKQIARDHITNPQLLNLVLDTIDKSVFVLTKPSSTSGKYHPPDEFCEFGMVKHILKALAFGSQGLRRYGLLSTIDKDIVVASIILHDIPFRLGRKEGKFYTYPNHALKNALDFRNKVEEFEVPINYTYPITCAIGYHSGIWQDYTDSFYEGLDKDLVYNKVVQEADYYASRKFVMVDTNIEVISQLLNDNLKG